MTTTSSSNNSIMGQQDQQPKRKTVRLVSVLQKAAAVAIQECDPWANKPLVSEAAELVVRHIYDPIQQVWTTDETIVKIEKVPFTHGAMRYCYRLKKRAQPPMSATNHRFHKMGWSHASNYVAKAYIDPSTGTVDCSASAKRAVQNDILLQHEAQYWAEKFNEIDPPSKIVFIRAYAIEFVNRPGKPWMAVERFITGTDMYGVGFIKHNTNSGYIDTELRRVTPQIFSAYTFYKSNGNRLVADIQGVGNLYTDPMILSQDYRYGDGDLGPRGMALFFNSFKPCGASDSLGIPIFPLSRNEQRVLTKYEADEETVSENDNCLSNSIKSPKNNHHITTTNNNNDDSITLESDYENEILDAFQRLDINRKRRASVLLRPPKDLFLTTTSPSDDERKKDTVRRSNLSSRKFVSDSIRQSMSVFGQNNTTASTSTTTSPSKPRQYTNHHIHRTSSDIDEVQECLRRAQYELDFTYKDYHRTSSGDLRQRHFKGTDTTKLHKSAIIRTISQPIFINDETRINLGRVHYQLAILHGMGRFPETIPTNTVDANNDDEQQHKSDVYVDHDVYSVLFHLSYAAALRNVPACLALGRVQSGLQSSVSNLLHTIVPTDFVAAKTLLQLAMNSAGSTTSSTAEATTTTEGTNNSDESSKDTNSSAKPRVAAGCLLLQILQDESRLAELNNDGINRTNNNTSNNRYDNDGDDDDTDTNSRPSGIASSHTLETMMIEVIQQTLFLMDLQEKEEQAVLEHSKILSRSTQGKQAFCVGDRVNANYMMEGTYYPAIVQDVVDNDTTDQQTNVTVQYDDGSRETLPSAYIQLLRPPTATQTTLGGPLVQTSVSDSDAFGDDADEEHDDAFILKKYELQYDLACIYEKRKIHLDKAITLYEEAADGAMQDGKMKIATECSLKASELMSS